VLLVFPLAFHRVDHDRAGVVVPRQLHVDRRLHQHDHFTPDRVELEVLQQDVVCIGRERHPRQGIAIDDRGVYVLVEHVFLH
jgi:hypothetical protein